MSNMDFLLVLMGPLAGFATGLVVFFIARRDQHRVVAIQPDYHGHRRTPAE